MHSGCQTSTSRMQNRDREKIDGCMNEISRKINMKELWPQLLRRKVFNHDDVNVRKWQNKLDEEKIVLDILKTIKTRGPNAFKDLLGSLRETRNCTGHDEAADLLEGKRPLAAKSSVPSSNRQPLSCPTPRKKIKIDIGELNQFLLSDKPLVINVTPATNFMDVPDGGIVDKYQMRSQPRGYALILSVKMSILGKIREAADRDEENLYNLFSNIGYDVTKPEPGTALTGSEIVRNVREFAQKDFDNVDSCFVIISAHGSTIQYNGALETEIHGVDYDTAGATRVLCKDLVDMFTNENCSQLKNKPKAFIFQTCRKKTERKLPVDNLDPPQDYSDILIAHSTMLDQFAYRSKSSGSFFITILCYVFMRYAYNTHVEDLLKKVHSLLKEVLAQDNMKQLSTVKNISFDKHLFLNPGLNTAI